VIPTAAFLCLHVLNSTATGSHWRKWCQTQQTKISPKKQILCLQQARYYHGQSNSTDLTGKAAWQNMSADWQAMALQHKHNHSLSHCLHCSWTTSEMCGCRHFGICILWYTDLCLHPPRLWSRSRRLSLKTYQRLVSRKIVNVSVLSQSRPFTSRAQNKFSAKLCRPH